MLLKGGTNKQGREEPWAMFRSHEFQGRSVTIALVTPLPTWRATAFFKSYFLILNSHSVIVQIFLTVFVNEVTLSYLALLVSAFFQLVLFVFIFCNRCINNWTGHAFVKFLIFLLSCSDLPFFSTNYNPCLCLFTSILCLWLNL